MGGPLERKLEAYSKQLRRSLGFSNLFPQFSHGDAFLAGSHPELRTHNQKNNNGDQSYRDKSTCGAGPGLWLSVNGDPALGSAALPNANVGRPNYATDATQTDNCTEDPKQAPTEDATHTRSAPNAKVERPRAALARWESRRQ